MMSSGTGVFFIQNTRVSSSSKTNSMPLVSARLSRHMRPRRLASGVAATSTLTLSSPAFPSMATVAAGRPVQDAADRPSESAAEAAMTDCKAVLATVKSRPLSKEEMR